LTYKNDDGSVYVSLGQAYAETGEYKSAEEALNKGLALDPTQRQAYLYLATSDLQLNNLDNAESNFKKAIQYYPDSFDANIGLTQVFYKQGTFGNAYLQAETSKSKAKNDTQLALVIYWRGLSQVGRGSIGDAIKDFQTLLSMPASDMTPQMRKDAQDQLSKLVTPTITPTPTRTPRITSTPIPSKTPIPTGTPTPTKTPVPTKTP